MKYCFFLLVALVTLAAACSWGNSPKHKPDIVKDTLLYQYHTFKQRAADCSTQPDSDCTVIQIKYPVFHGAAALNDTVRHRAAGLFGVYQKSDTSFKQFAAHFMKAYQQEMVNRNAKMIYTLQTTASVVRQDSSLVAMQLSGYSFQGGAHGSSLTMFMNWDAKSSKVIKLNEILIDNYQHPLDSIGEKIFRTQEKLSDTEPLKINYFFAKDKFALNDNFLITPTGLRFLYNEYDIKPYAGGKTELFIPYAQIQLLLRPNSVVSQYHQ
jgi:hypothetical protein